MKIILPIYLTIRIKSTLMALTLIALLVAGTQLMAAPPPGSKASSVAYPLKVSANRRYLG
jgi:hypothetical protein